jgi:hypothetical protein
MYFAWLAHHSLTAPDKIELTVLLDRSVTPGAFLLQHCCGEVSGFMPTPEGFAFSKATYRADLGVYRRIPEIARRPVAYAAPDKWETYDAVAPAISQDLTGVYHAQTA